MFFEKYFPKKVLYLLAFGFLIRLFFAWLPEKYFFYLVSDDAYYYFSIAKNLVSRGMFSADGITVTNGFHPLWLFVITPIFIFFKTNSWFNIHLALTFSAIFDTAAAFLIYKTLQHLGKEKVGFWATAFYLVNPYGLLHTMNGLETAQNNFFLALLVYLSVKANTEWLKANWFGLGAVCGLALLSRTDNIFVVSILLFYLLWRYKNLQATVYAVSVAALLVLPWLIYNLSTFGTIVQTSGAAYPYIFHQQYLNEFKTYLSTAIIPHLLKLAFYSFNDNAFHYGGWIFTFVIGTILIARLKNLTEKYRSLLWTLAGAGLFIGFHLLVRWSVRPWYPQAIFVLTLPLVALACEKISHKIIWPGSVFALLLSGSWAATTPFPVADRSKVMLSLIQNRISADDQVGVFNSGYVQYFTDRQVINLDGLVNNEVIQYYKKKEGLRYFRERNIRWLLDTQGYLLDFFEPYFGVGSDSLLAVEDYYTNISVPANNVFLLRVSADGIHTPSAKFATFGELVKLYHQKASQKHVISIPFVNYFKVF